MFTKILTQVVIVIFFLSIPAIAQKSISLSDSEKLKTIEKNADSETSKAKTIEIVKFSKFEQEVFDEVNDVRQNPSSYVAYLNAYKKMLKGKVLYRPNLPGNLMNEGSPAIDEAISDLQNTNALQGVTASKLLTIVANNQLNDLKENPDLGHYGKDGSDFRKRLAKVGKSGKFTSENINYRDRIARDTILSLIIDDGVKSRTHRKNILNPNFNLMGIACGIAKGELMICVLVLADKFAEVNPVKQAVPIEIL